MAHSSAEPPSGLPRNEGGRARPTLPGPLRGALAVLAVGLGYAALAEVTFTLADAGTPAFFPAAGLSLAAFLLAPRRIWPFFLVAIATAEIVLDRSHGIPGGTALLMAVANAAEPMVAASLLLALSGGVVALRTTRDLVRLVGAGAVGALVGAAVGTAAIAQVAGDGGWWPTIGQWWAGDAIGQIVVAPLILSLTRATVSVRPSRPVVEAIVAGAVLVGASVGAYVLAESAVAYLVVAGTLWSGLRFGTRGVAFAGVVTAGIAAAAAAGHIETTLAPGGDAADTLVLVDVFLAVSLVSAHLLATEIHGRHVVEGRLRERELALRAVVDRSPLPITEVDPATGAVLSWNPAAERLFGWTADEAVGSVGLILPPEDADAHADLRRLTIESGEGHEVDVVRVRKDGTRLPVRASAAPIFDEGGVPRRIVVVIQDMSGQKQLESELLHQAQHDALTGLQNRAVLVDRLAHALRLQARHGGALAVLFCDVDRFKVINDSLGHHVGDELLREVGRRIAGAIRDTDTLARFGGDEFVVLAENVTGPRGAVEIARRIGERVAEPYLLEGRELRTSASIGIAVAEGGGAGPDELMRDADAAMYRAKERGRARFEIFDAEMREWTEARLDTEIALREAIRRDELEVHYQPVVSLRDGTVHTVEALVRWRRGGELVSPAVFIPLAEELGLIDEIGAWVMRTSCARLAAWRSMLGGAAPGSVSVNLSPRQVADSALPEHVAAILADTGLPAEALALELTESAMLGDADRALESLTALRDLGLRLAIDDFGTGYSSLSYLRRLPVDIVKIDRSFLLQLGTNPQDATIVGAVVDLAHSLGLDVVAEGIETPEQLRELVRLGCDHVQGFLLARPLPEAELVPVLARGGLLGAHLPERLAG